MTGATGSSAPVLVVLGARTRLGTAVIVEGLTAGRRVVALARHADDADALRSTGAEVLPLSDVSALQGVAALDLTICALGPVHPDADHWVADQAAFDRDLAAIDTVVSGAETARTVLVSTVIAAAPGEGRRYYGGWKGLVEAQVRSLLRRHRAPELAVVYPGRIAESGGGPLHTSYSRLAGTVLALAETPGASRLAGLDARLWLLVHGALVMLGAILPGRTLSRGRTAAGAVKGANSR